MNECIAPAVCNQYWLNPLTVRCFCWAIRKLRCIGIWIACEQCDFGQIFSSIKRANVIELPAAVDTSGVHPKKKREFTRIRIQASRWWWIRTNANIASDTPQSVNKQIIRVLCFYCILRLASAAVFVFVDLSVWRFVVRVPSMRIDAARRTPFPLYCHTLALWGSAALTGAITHA